MQDNVVWRKVVKAGGLGCWELALLIIHEKVNAGGEGVSTLSLIPLKAKISGESWPVRGNGVSKNNTKLIA